MQKCSSRLLYHIAITYIHTNYLCRKPVLLLKDYLEYVT